MPESIAAGEITSRLNAGQELARCDPAAGLLVTWAAAEAVMRSACQRHAVELPDYRPATLVGKLYMEGLLEREEYDDLVHVMQVRNAAAHGFRSNVDVSAVQHLREIALKLLKQRRK